MTLLPSQLAAVVSYDGTPKQNTPADLGLIAWGQDPSSGAAGFQPAAGVLNLCRIPIRTPVLVATGGFEVTQAGSGAQLPVNVFIGLYDQNGNRIGAGSAALDTPVQTAGYKTATLGIGAGLSLAPGWVWLAFLIGTQSTTPVQLVGTPATIVGNWGTVAASSRYGTVGAALSALPATITPSAITPARSLIGAIL